MVNFLVVSFNLKNSVTWHRFTRANPCLQSSFVFTCWVIVIPLIQYTSSAFCIMTLAFQAKVFSFKENAGPCHVCVLFPPIHIQSLRSQQNAITYMLLGFCLCRSMPFICASDLMPFGQSIKVLGSVCRLCVGRLIQYRCLSPHKKTFPSNLYLAFIAGLLGWLQSDEIDSPTDTGCLE